MSTFEFMAEAAKEKLVAAVASVKQWPVLAKATSNDDEPTPGYLFDEISTLTWISTNDCTEVQNYLLKRLEKDAPIVKLKTLRVLKHVILKGHEGFHRDLQRRFQPIKDCTQYRGPSDMLHGDAPFRLVREAAAEVMELVYENPASIKRQVPKAIEQQQQQQMMMNASNNAAISAHHHGTPRSTSATSFSSSGSSMSSQGSMSSASDKSKMWGYGNPNYVEPPPSMLDKMKDKVTETLTSMADSKPSYPSNYRGNVNNFNQGGAQSLPSKNATIDSYAAAKNAKISYEDGPVRKAGEIGGGWDTPSATPASAPYVSTPSVSAYPTSREPSYEPSSAVSKPSPLESSSGVADSYRESLLVDSITQQGGVRAAPTRQALSEFCARAKQLNLSVVIDLLLDKCRGESNEKMKSLYALEAMLVDGLPGAEGKLADRSASLQEVAASDPNSAVKTKANKILLLLGVNVNSSADLPGPSLLDPAGDENELFAGMSVKDETPAPKASDDLLGAFFQDVQPPRPQSHQTQAQSILAQFQTQPVAAAPLSQPRQQPQQQLQQPKPAPAPQQQADSFMFFQDEPVATSAAASNQISLLELISQPSSQPQAQPHAQARSQSLDLLSMNDDLLSSSSDNLGAASLHPISAGGPKSSDPFVGLVSNTIPQGKVDLKKVPMNSLPKTGPAMSAQPTTSFSSPFFPTSPGLLNSSSSSSIIAPVARPAAHESKPAFSFMDSKKDAFEFVQEEIRKK